MEKNKKILKTVTTVVITVIAIIIITSFIKIPILGGVIVPKSQYNEMIGTYTDFGKVGILKTFIQEESLKKPKTKTMTEGSLKGLFASLEDPYSVYLTKEEMKEYKAATSGKFVGIGITIRADENNNIEVVSIIKDSPAEKSKIKVGDIIDKVDSKKYSGKELDIAASKIKGETGTKVNISLIRLDDKDKPKEIDLDIKREEVKTESISSKILEDDIAYVSISGFEEETFKDFKKNIKTLENEGMKGLVIDLRNNGGGNLNIATDIADMLMGKGTIVYTKNRAGDKEYIKSDKSKLKIPVTIIVNGESASASEVLSAAVQDSKEGTIIGTKTYGKGVVQLFKELSDGSGFKLTISEYFSPKGKTIDGKGIKPDIKVKLPKEVKTIGLENLEEDVQLKKAIEVIKEKMK